MENKITLENLNSFCRFCLLELRSERDNNEICNELQRNSELIHILPIQLIEQNVYYPKFICHKCSNNLKNLQEFCATALHSIRTLGNISEITKNKPNHDWLQFDDQIQKDHQIKTIRGNNLLIPKKLEMDNFFVDTSELVEIGVVGNIEPEIQFQSAETLFSESVNLENLRAKNIQSGHELLSALVSDDSSDIPIAAIKTNLKPYTKCSKDKNLENLKTNYRICENLITKKCKMFHCEICPRRFSSKEHLHEHASIHKELQQFQLEETVPTTALRKKCKAFNKNDVVKTKTSETKYRCEMCPRRFICQENLDAHIRTHRGLKPFQCMQCECSYVKATRLREHILSKHSDVPVEKKQIACTYEGCDKVFRHNSSLKMHYNLKHAKIKPVLKTYICEDCGRTCKNMASLRKHLFTHGPVEDYPYQCQHCGKSYISQCTYKEHLLRHAGIKNFECHFCGMKKTTRKELLTHINFHTKERQWSCQLCSMVFNTGANLRRHDRVVHQGIRSYTCRFCNESFGKPDTLKHHEMRHTGEKPHVCSVCSKRFIQAIALKTHMKIHLKNVEKTESSTPNAQKLAAD